MKMIKWLILFFMVCTAIFSLWNAIKPTPVGLSYKGPAIKTDNVSFLWDVSYSRDGQFYKKQTIFNEIFRVIDSAEKFVFVDMFLYNDDYDRTKSYDPLARNLTDHLIFAAQRGVQVVLITDPINTFYGAYENPYLNRLKDAGIDVVITNLTPLRDSNPLYSGFYRTFISPLGVSQSRTIENPFSPDSPKVSLTAFLKMINFKANHRKLVATEKNLIVTSANPHDASSNHANIALTATNPQLIRSALVSEQTVLRFSGSTVDLLSLLPDYTTGETSGLYTVNLITESRIRDSIRSAVQTTEKNDTIAIGVFYLSHRGVISDLKKASQRGVKIRILLDANKDAFGREKNGVPNRQVAEELAKAGKGNIEIRWILTHGEQFHSKLILVKKSNEAILIGGSSNYTRRNFDSYNLETDLMVTGPPDAPLFLSVDNWFEMLWNNKEEEYSTELNTYSDNSTLKIWQYRLMEATGLSTF